MTPCLNWLTSARNKFCYFVIKCILLRYTSEITQSTHIMSTLSYMSADSSFHWHIGRENKRSLTGSQKGFIFANHNDMTIYEMAKLLGKSYTAIQKYVHKYNLKTKTNNRNGNKK